MKADAITARIIEDAKAQAERTLSEAKSKADALEKEYDAELDRKRGEAEASTERQIADMRDRMLRMAMLDQKKEMLAVKREVIDMAFEDALKRMYQMPEKNKREYIAKLIIDSADGSESIIPSVKDKAIFNEGFINEVNAQLKKAGKEPVALSDQTRDIEGGFVLCKGGMEINCAYKSVLGQYRSTLEAEVARFIFN